MTEMKPEFRRLATAIEGGGYALGSGNSVPDEVKIKNFRTMIDTCRSEGRYPIDVNRL